ncbi:MAG: dynamin family protein [Muribaculaceae bacterium]|nr:dynamin family protein [Muribaculaceae bacterium]
MDTQNDFMLLRQTVKEVVEQYKDLRKLIDWKDKGKSATIMRLAKPFLDGYFTIAVAGKMSAGKSTFINSLIGENLLPTGHFQTTSGITWIVSSDKRYMDVTYADGKKKTFTTDLASELRKLVAIPERYEELPINHINILIKQDDGVKEILEKKAGIEAMTGTSAPDSLWQEYINNTPKSSIPENVTIYLQLPKEYEGWRIVDTPGVGAVGGIQDATKKLLTSKEGEDRAYAVDAVVLLHNSKEHIQDETANKFAEDISKSMGDLATGRLFFVLTHAGDSDFLRHKDLTLEKAQVLFGSKLKIPAERINYVDSLIHHFLTSAKDSGRDFSNPVSLQSRLPGWTEEDWGTITGVLAPFYVNFITSGKECTNSSLFEELENVSRFNSLREMLYEFLNKEKEKSFSKLFELIESEFKAYKKSLELDIKSVSSGKEAIERQIKDLIKEKSHLEIALGKIRDKATKAAIDRKFSFIEEEFMTLSSLDSIGEVRTNFLQIIEKGLRTEKELFSSLIGEFSNYVAKFDNVATTFDSLDFGEIEREATKFATSKVPDLGRPKTEYVCCGEDKQTYPHKKDKVDFDKKRRQFTAKVISEGRTQLSEFKRGLGYKMNAFYDVAKRDIDEKTNAAVSRLNNYKEDYSEKECILSTLESKLSSVVMALENLKKFED